MARIEGVPRERAGWIARFVYWMARRRVGQVPEPMTIQARHKRIFRAYCAFEYNLDKARLVEVRIKSLASLWAAKLVGCPF